MDHYYPSFSSVFVEMKQLANDQFEMNIIYGDTDSIFVSGISNAEHDHNLPVPAFTASCKRNLGVDGCDVMLIGTHYSSTANKGNDINNNDKKSNNIQRNESLDKYRSLPQSLVMLAPQG